LRGAQTNGADQLGYRGINEGYIPLDDDGLGNGQTEGLLNPLRVLLNRLSDKRRPCGEFMSRHFHRSPGAECKFAGDHRPANTSEL
jgi:hypothetical protein